jgi:hypothetical protein
MGLSEQERKVLEELERGLYAEDPKLASRMGKTEPKPEDARRTPATRMIAGTLVAVGGLSVILVGVIAHYTAIGVGGFLMTLAGLVIATSVKNSPAGKSGKSNAPMGGNPGNKPGAKSKASKLKPSEFFEDRWDKRMNGEL